MRKTIALFLFSCLAVNATALVGAAATRRIDSYNSTAYAPQNQQQFSAEQLDNLLAPIALYPDPLLAQVIPASTFVDQVEQAARWLRANTKNTAQIDNQPWDVSVKSISHYPQVVYMMSDKLDWTTAIGQAYVNQSTDVMTSIQRLRAKAKAAGNLASNQQQIVIVEKEVIKVVPAQPQVIYVPTYNPQVVYVQQPAPSGPSTGTVVATAAVAFGVGLAMGAWLNNDCNWYSHTVYYHGWHGTGWVATSRSHVHVNNNYYVNNRYSSVNVNRAVVNQPVRYNNISTYNNVSRNVNYNNVNVNNVNRNNVNVNNVNRNNVNVNNVNRNNVNTNNVNRNNVNTNNVNRNNVANQNINTNDARIDSMRGRTTNSGTGTANRPAAQPATQQRPSAFGGFGSGAQTRAQSQRGQASRATTQQSASGRFAGGNRSSGEARSGSGRRASGGRKKN